MNMKIKEIARIEETNETLVCMFNMYTANYYVQDNRGVLTRKIDTTPQRFLNDLRVIGYTVKVIVDPDEWEEELSEIVCDSDSNFF